VPSEETPAPHERVAFAHESERHLAELLDFYGIEWRYEPATFVLARDEQGRPTEAFCPDFYLPAYDRFIELTTLRQKLVTRKNRKVRRLAEAHPEVEVKLLYRRDYHHLAAKYGLG
jgi:hypoxanthine phosphoribosyltransferase